MAVRDERIVVYKLAVYVCSVIAEGHKGPCFIIFLQSTRLLQQKNVFSDSLYRFGQTVTVHISWLVSLTLIVHLIV